MRHSIYGKKLSRDKNQRTALFKSLIQSLILSEKIETTKAKAQAIKGLVDRLVTQAKTPTTRRLVSQFLTDKRVYNKLVDDLAPRMQTRNSGYTSIIKTGFRQGDGSMMVQMRLLLEESKEGQKLTEVKTQPKTEKEPQVQKVESSAKAPKRPVKATKSAKPKKEVAK